MINMPNKHNDNSGNSVPINCKFWSNLAWQDRLNKSLLKVLSLQHWSETNERQLYDPLYSLDVAVWCNFGSDGVTRLYFFEEKGNCSYSAVHLHRHAVVPWCYAVSVMPKIKIVWASWCHSHVWYNKEALHVYSSNALSLNLVMFHVHWGLQTWWS